MAVQLEDHDSVLVVRTVDRVSLGLAIFFGIAALGMGVAWTQSLSAPPLRLAMMIFLLALWCVLGVVQFRNARSSLEIAPGHIRRTGPLGWMLTRDQIGSVTLIDNGKCSVQLVVRDSAARIPSVARALSWSWWLHPRDRRRHTIITRIDPTRAAEVAAALTLDELPD